MKQITTTKLNIYNLIYIYICEALNSINDIDRISQKLKQFQQLNGRDMQSELLYEITHSNGGHILISEITLSRVREEIDH